MYRDFEKIYYFEKILFKISKVFYGVSFINLEFYIRYMFLHVKTFCSIIRKSLYFMFLRVWFIYDFLFFLFYTLSHDFETMNEFYISIFKF